MRCNPGHSHRHIHHHHHHHSHCGPCYGGSVFTFSHHCGGNSRPFWSGFGAGLGMGLGNMLGGFMNSFTSGFGNMFGSFGNMFGGFGMPMMGGFGMGGFGMPWAASYGGGTVKDDAYFASRYGTGKSSTTTTSTCSCGYNNKAGGNTGTADVVTGNANLSSNPSVSTDYIITIKGIETKIEDIKNLADIQDLTDDEINSSVTEKEAEDILINLGYIDVNDGVKIGKMSTEYVVLKLLEKSGVIVECANNQSADDKWIKGKITNVKKDESTDKLSYDIDCKGVKDAMFGYKYTFKQIDDVDGKKAFKVTTVNKNGSSKQGHLIKDENENRVYVYDENNEYLAKKVPKIYLISSKSSDDRNEVE